MSDTDKPDDSCELCGGTGEREVQAPNPYGGSDDDVMIRCNHCDGTGKEPTE